MAKTAPWFNEDLYSLYFLLKNNQRARLGYARTLVNVAGIVRAGPETSDALLEGQGPASPPPSLASPSS